MLEILTTMSVAVYGAFEIPCLMARYSNNQPFKMSHLTFQILQIPTF